MGVEWKAECQATTRTVSRGRGSDRGVEPTVGVGSAVSGLKREAVSGGPEVEDDATGVAGEVAAVHWPPDPAGSTEAVSGGPEAEEGAAGVAGEVAADEHWPPDTAGLTRGGRDDAAGVAASELWPPDPAVSMLGGGALTCTVAEGDAARMAAAELGPPDPVVSLLGATVADPGEQQTGMRLDAAAPAGRRAGNGAGRREGAEAQPQGTAQETWLPPGWRTGWTGDGASLWAGQREGGGWAAWLEAGWPRERMKEQVYRSFNSPGTVMSVADADDPYTFDWSNNPEDEIRAQRRFLGHATGFLDFVALREAVFGEVPSRRDDPEQFQAYYAKVSAWYKGEQRKVGVDGDLDPAWVDLCFADHEAGTEYPLRRVVVDMLTRGMTDEVSVDAAGSWAGNMVSATAPERRRVWGEHMEKELASGWVRLWDLGTSAAIMRRRFVCPLGLVPKRPDKGEQDPEDYTHWRLVRNYSKAQRGTSINERFPPELAPKFLDWAGAADAVEGMIELGRRNPECELQQIVLDLSKMYRHIPLCPARFGHYAYEIPEKEGEGSGMRLVYDTRGPFGLRVCGFCAMYLSLGITWAVRNVEVPLLLGRGETIDFTLFAWCDDFHGCADRGAIQVVRTALIRCIEGMNFPWRGKLEEANDIDGCIEDQSIPDTTRIWIGAKLCCRRGAWTVQMTPRLRGKCIAGILGLLGAVQEGTEQVLDIPRTDGSWWMGEQSMGQLTGRLQFAAWMSADGRAALRPLYEALAAGRRGECGPTAWQAEWTHALKEWLGILNQGGEPPVYAFGHYAESGGSDGKVVVVWTDAQPGNHDQSKQAGFGIFVGGVAVQGVFPDHVLEWAAEGMPKDAVGNAQPDNNVLESLAHAWGMMLSEILMPGIGSDRGVPIAYLTDSATARGARRKGSCRAPRVTAVVGGLAAVMRSRVDMQVAEPFQIRSEAMDYADPLSRMSGEAFKRKFWEQVRATGEEAGLDFSAGWEERAVVFIDLPPSWYYLGRVPVDELTSLPQFRLPSPDWSAAYRLTRLQVAELIVPPEGKAATFGRHATARTRRTARRGKIQVDSGIGRCSMAVRGSA